MDRKNDFALVLSGGGARGAYQAGAIRALFEICREKGNLYPFRNLVGVSAGAINAAYLASEADNLERATDKLVGMWRQLTTPDIFRTDTVTVGRTALRLVRGVTLGGFSDRLRPAKLGLLNIDPLQELLSENIQFSRIHQQIQSQTLHSLAITATDYSTSIGVTFLMGAPDVESWTRVQRIGIREQIGVDHIMGSAAIPIFFPPWKIGDRYFGDGCLRNTSPLSPARKIGASKILVIGVRRQRLMKLDSTTNIRPTLGRVLGVVINALFMDAIEADIERVRIINENLKISEPQHAFRHIDIHLIQPSMAPSELAETRVAGLPPILRFLISGLGNPRESAEILSYLTFDPIYLNSLIDLGYEDTQKQKEKLTQFLNI